MITSTASRLPFTPGMLQFHKINRKIGLEPRQTLDWKEKTLRPVDKEGVGQWKALLSAADISAFEERSADTLQLLGYS